MEKNKGGVNNMGLIWLIILVLVSIWLFGNFIFIFGGNLIHLLLVLALILVVYNLYTGRKII